MSQFQTKQIQLFSSNSLVRKFRVTHEIPIEHTWMEVVQRYFLENLNEEFRSAERMYNELGLSCNSKAILWDDTVATSMRRDKIGVRSELLKVNIRKRLNSLALTPHRRNDLFHHQFSVDQYQIWGGDRSQSQTTDESEEGDPGNLQSRSAPPQSQEPVAGPSWATGLGLPLSSSTPRRPPQFEHIPKFSPYDESAGQMPNQTERIEPQIMIQSVSSGSVRNGGDGTVASNHGGEQEEGALDERNAGARADRAIIENYREKFLTMTPEQVLQMRASVRFINGVLTEDCLEQIHRLRECAQLLNGIFTED